VRELVGVWRKESKRINWRWITEKGRTLFECSDQLAKALEDEEEREDGNK
jgi:ribonuclease HI